MGNSFGPTRWLKHKSLACSPQKHWAVLLNGGDFAVLKSQQLLVQTIEKTNARKSHSQS